MGGQNEATYLEDEGCPDDVVHPECHSGQKTFITSMCQVSLQRVSLVQGPNGWSNAHFAAQRPGGGKFGDDVGDYVSTRRPLNVPPPPAAGRADAPQAEHVTDEQSKSPCALR